MARYSGTVTDQNGVLLPGALVLVQSGYDASLAVLTDDSGGDLKNPLVCDKLGAFTFNTTDGQYDLTYLYGGRIIREFYNLTVGSLFFALPPTPSAAGKYMAFDANGYPVPASGTGADAGLRTDLAAGGANLLGSLGGVTLAPGISGTLFGQPMYAGIKQVATGASTAHAEIANYTEITSSGGTGQYLKFKIGVFSRAILAPGGSDTFAANLVIDANPGAASDDSAVGLEIDINNNKQDYTTVSHPYVTPLLITAGGSKISTAAITVDYGSATMAFNYGIYFGGAFCVNNATFCDNTSAPTTLQIRGPHTYGIDTGGAQFTGAAIRLANMHSVKFRNAAATTDLEVLKVDAGDNLIIGAGVTAVVTGQAIAPAATGAFSVGTSGLPFGSGYFNSLNLLALPVYADNAAATSGGIPVGRAYRTSTGQLMVRY